MSRGRKTIIAASLTFLLCDCGIVSSIFAQKKTSGPVVIFKGFTDGRTYNSFTDSDIADNSRQVGKTYEPAILGFVTETMSKQLSEIM